MKSAPVGIDLGTTYSAMARINDAGLSVVISNAEGDLITPSVVLFEDDNVIVGQQAKSVSFVSPNRVAICAKRDMGKPFYHKPIDGKYVPPEVIQSYILRKLKNDITANLGDEFSAIITVPAYFDEPRRKATYQAGEMAGLKVLDILNEPTAAALVFGEEQGYLTRFGAPKDRLKVVVYDLGGGTFDVTLIDMKPGDLKTLCTDGDVQLGGFDWDMRLVNFMAEEFIKRYGSDPRKNPSTLQQLIVEAEAAKHRLSEQTTTTAKVDYKEYTVVVQIARAQFEDMTADLLERTRYTTRQLLVTAGLEWGDIDRILLTGGSTRMPMVQQMLRELTSIEPDHSVSPDEAVARGAAIYAKYVLASQQDSGHEPTFDVTNVNAHSLGIEGFDPQTSRRRNRVLIRRNTPLPARRTAECVTKDAGQPNIVVQVLEGESMDPDECSAIGRTVIREMPPELPKGWPVEITYEYGVNGRLQVTAKVRGTDNVTSLELERDEAMSSDHMNQWRNIVADETAGLDAFELAVAKDLRGGAGGAAKPAPNPAAPTPAAPAPATPTPRPPTPATAVANTPPPAVPKPAQPPVAPADTPAESMFQETAETTAHWAGQDPAQPSPGQRERPAMDQPAASMAFACPHCRGTFKVPTSFSGRQMNCPKCQGKFIVPHG